jgi:hypothetical protein
VGEPALVDIVGLFIQAEVVDTKDEGVFGMLGLLLKLFNISKDS